MKEDIKLCVYAICKNESKFIDRWIESIKDEADCVAVLDTGSTDGSYEKLKSYEPYVTVKQFDYMKELGYFRFDKARNDSLKLVPFDVDVCVILDLDHIPRKGWGNLIKDYYKQGYHEVAGFIVDHDQQGRERNRWRSKNVHPNSGLWQWDRVIHEGIKYRGDGEIMGIFDENFVIDHYPDETKDRSLYRNLLEYACKEYPKDPYYGIYLGVEYDRRYGKDLAIEAFERCLRECDFTNDQDIHIQVCLNLATIIINDNDKALHYIEMAKRLGANNRRLYSIEADIYERMEEPDKAIRSLETALLIESNSNDWKDDASLFRGLIEDRLSLFYYYSKHDILKALSYNVKALSLDPSNERIYNNFSYFVKEYKESREKQND